jgi:cobalt-zinc-cadmium efflux system membrane fusion protein
MKRFAFGLAALFLAGCGQQAPVEVAKEEPVVATDELKLSAEAAKAGGIETGTVSQQMIQAVLEVPGSVSIPGNARATVTPPVAGKIVRLFASVGDSIRAGQALAEIQSGDLAQATSFIASAETAALQAEAAVRQQASAVDLARGSLRTAQAGLTRQRQFAAAGAFSQPTLTAARNEVSETETESAAARSQLVGAQSRLERSERLSKEGLVSKADLDQARLDVQQAQIRVDRASQRLALAQQTLQRETKVGSQGLLNAREIQTAEAEVRAAKLEADQALISLQGAKSAQVGAQRAIASARTNASALRGGSGGGGSTVTLTAPISGIVTERQATLGQAVERASDLFDIEDGRVVWVTANVPESAISSVRPGVVVSVATDAYPGRSFTGVVQVIGTRLDPKTRTLPVQCRVPNPARLLRADLFARVRIATGKRVRATAVPPSALVGEPDDQAVFVSAGGKFERRKVKVGRTDGKFVEILEGLKVGEKVAITGVFTLQSELRKGELKEEE